MAHSLKSFRKTYAEINLDNLAFNFKLLSQLMQNPFICPMVKANAYGHGDVEVALRLQAEGAKVLGVGLLEEGILLRQNGIKCEILVFGLFDRRGAEEIFRWNLVPVISTWAQMNHLESAYDQWRKPEQKLRLHIKFDTGMHRLGFSPEDSVLWKRKIELNTDLYVEGICSHFHSAENLLNAAESSQEQLNLYRKIEQQLAGCYQFSHFLNSTALLLSAQLPSLRTLGARPGLALYGVSPIATNLPLKPVMSLRSSVVKYHVVRKGDSVSYGGTWVAPKDSIIGVVPIGYADGCPRSSSNHFKVLVNGLPAQQVGTVCMDYIMICLDDCASMEDLTTQRELDVTLFGQDFSGKSISANTFAEGANTVAWEVLSRVGERVPRFYLGQRGFA